MLDRIIDIDKWLMVTLNAPQNHTNILDTFMWLTSQPTTWIGVYVVLLVIFIRAKKKEIALILLFTLLTVLLCDQISSGLIKPLVGRLRPSHDPSIMDQLRYVGDYRGGQFGFPSSHATNAFGLATLFTLILRNKWAAVGLYTYAVICAYSRIYLGVHYPGDITVGAILGTMLGYLCYIMYAKTREGWLSKWSFEGQYGRYDGLIVAGSVVATFLVFIIVGMIKTPNPL